MKNKNFLRIGMADLIKGCIVSVISALLTGIYTLIQVGTFPPDVDGWKAMGIVALGSGISYLIKNLLQNSEGKFLTKEIKK